MTSLQQKNMGMVNSLLLVQMEGLLLPIMIETELWLVNMKNDLNLSLSMFLSFYHVFWLPKVPFLIKKVMFNTLISLICMRGKMEIHQKEVIFSNSFFWNITTRQAIPKIWHRWERIHRGSRSGWPFYQVFTSVRGKPTLQRWNPPPRGSLSKLNCSKMFWYHLI